MNKYVFFALTFLLAACQPLQREDAGLQVLASTSFLADIAQNVAGDRLKVKSLLPVGTDPHAYQAAPADVMKITEADLLILNGLEYEHFIESLVENSGGEYVVVVASNGIDPHHGEEHPEDTVEEGHTHEAGDPHMWLDPNLVSTYIENIRDGLIRLDPQGADVYRANTEAYIAQLDELDLWIVEQVDQIPPEQRLLVTNHEALGYFAERYGFEIVDSILPGFSSEANASAQEIAGSIEAIRSSGVTAIFLDDVENVDLADQIAVETGVMVVGDLHLESLTDGPPAATYIEMMKHNVLRIVDALK